MKDFDKFKQEYESLTPSDSFAERIEKTMKKEKRTSNLKKSVACVAGALVICTASVNLSPSLAYGMSTLPVLGSLVQVMTFGKYQVNENGYEADVAIPQVQGLMNKELETMLNKTLKENAAEIFTAFEADMAEMKKEFGENEVHMGLSSGYEIKTNNDTLLAFDVYLLNTAGSSSTTKQYYTIDKKEGSLLTLAGLFQENTDYITPISHYLKEEMLRMNKEEDGMFFIDGQEDTTDGFKTIAPDQSFYLDGNGNLVICFNKYDVAAGAQGCPEFIIPKTVTKDIIKPLL